MPQYIIVKLDPYGTLGDGWLFTRKVFTDAQEAETFLDAQVVHLKAKLMVIEAPFPIPASLIADDWKQADGNTDRVCNIPRPATSATSKPSSYIGRIGGLPPLSGLPSTLRAPGATTLLTATEYRWLDEKPTDRLVFASPEQQKEYWKVREWKKRSERARRGVKTKRAKYKEWPCRRTKGANLEATFKKEVKRLKKEATK